MEQESDDILLAQMTAGDPDALRDLYARYRPRLWRYLRARLDGDAAAVDDLLQEIFLAIWQAASGYQPHGHAAAWIFRIAHHQLGHARRALSRRPEGHQARGDEDGEEGEAGSGTNGQRPTFEDGVLGRLALADALARLSPAHREVLLLVFQQGFTLEEAACILGIPVGTVKSRISYARRALLRTHVGVAAQEEGLP
jgi:RNA polymerase sigma-70 factor (ECF subfamily)